MLDSLQDDYKERIDAIVREFLRNPPATSKIHPEEDLEKYGLTSLDMVNLMLAVEAEFDVTIPGSKLIPANFRSIKNISGLVSELTH